MSKSVKDGARRAHLPADEIARLRFIAQEVARAVLAELDRRPANREYLSVRETAERLGLKPENLAGRVSEGFFGKKDGVRHVSRRVFIHWPTFEATVLSGDWKPPRGLFLEGNQRWEKWRRAHGQK